MIRRSASGELINRKETLEELIFRFRNLHATDPRDRIYALLGLARDKISFSVDYHKSTLEVYRDFVHHAITQQNSLDIILIPWAPVERRKKTSGSWSTEDKLVSSWLAPLEDLPYGGPQEDVTTCRPRRNGETFAGNPPIYDNFQQPDTKRAFWPSHHQEVPASQRSKS